MPGVSAFMFEWLSDLVRWLHDFISEVPIYVAGPAMVLIGALDSSLLSLPEINDYLVVARCYSDPKSVFYFPLFAALGSVLGCTLLYTIMRRITLLPPPMPFKIFVATAGALEYPRWKFMVTIMIARSVRYIVEGTLAVFYGEQVIDFMRVNGIYVVGAVASLVVIGVGGYVVVKRVRAPRRTAVEIAEGAEAEGDAGGRAAD